MDRVMHDDRGRNAKTPQDIPAKGLLDVAWRVWREVQHDRLTLIAAGVTFYALLAIFPTLSLFVSVYGLLADPTSIVDHARSVTSFLPTDTVSIFIDQLQALASQKASTLSLAAVFGLLFALWSAHNGLLSIFDALNAAYGEHEKRGFFARTFMRLALTIGVIIGFFLTVAVILVLPAVLAFVPLGDLTETVVTILRWPVVAAIAVVGLAIMYRYGPSRDDAEWKWVTPGAGIAVVLWLVASVAFATYVRNFGSYQETFGTLGGAIILLMWLWISSYIVLLGAEFDAEMEAQTKHDTTVGASEPMGERGAVKADQLGEAKGA